MTHEHASRPMSCVRPCGLCSVAPCSALRMALSSVSCPTALCCVRCAKRVQPAQRVRPSNGGRRVWYCVGSNVIEAIVWFCLDGLEIWVVHAHACMHASAHACACIPVSMHMHAYACMCNACMDYVCTERERLHIFTCLCKHVKRNYISDAWWLLVMSTEAGHGVCLMLRRCRILSLHEIEPMLAFPGLGLCCLCSWQSCSFRVRVRHEGLCCLWRCPSCMFSSWPQQTSS